MAENEMLEINEGNIVFHGLGDDRSYILKILDPIENESG
ncbi:DUF6386 family protein [Pseudomonas folii]